MRRARAEHHHENVEKRKSFVTFLIVGVTLLAAVGGVTVFVLSRKAAHDGKLVSRQDEAEVDAFIKDAKLNFTKAHVAKRGSAGGHRVGGAGNDADFNNDVVLGDVTRGGSDETLDDDVIQNVMMGHYRGLVPCVMQEKHRTPGLSDVSIDFVVLGTGKVKAVRVNGQGGTSFSGCIHDRMQTFGFPKFNGTKTIASWSMSMR